MSLDQSRKPAGKKRTVICFLTVSLVLHAVLLVFFADSGEVKRSSRVEVGLVSLPPLVAGEKSTPGAHLSTASAPAPGEGAPTPAAQRKGERGAPSPSGVANRPPDPPRLESAPETARKPPSSEPGSAFAESLPPAEFSAPAEKEAGHSQAHAGAGPPRMSEPAAFRDKGKASASVPLVEALPRYDSNAPPLYPRLARDRGWEGEVLLRVIVSEAGDVRRVSIERSSKHAVLDAAALRAVRRWRFHPSRLGPTPVEGEVLVPLRFKLSDF